MDSAARVLLSAIRMLEKLNLIPATDLHKHCVQVEGIRRIFAPNAAPRVFAETADLEHLGKSRDHWSWVRLFFLSLCAVVYRMRSGDSENVTWACVGVGGWLESLDEKVNKEWVAYPLSPFLETWRQYVCAHKHPGTPDDSPVMPGGRNALREALKSCFQRHSRRPLTWHPWGHLRAATFVRMGGTVANLTAWARWRSQNQARHYAKHPPQMGIQRLHRPPPPKEVTGSPSEDLELTTIKTRDLWPANAWKRQAGPVKPRAKRDPVEPRIGKPTPSPAFPWAPGGG